MLLSASSRFAARSIAAPSARPALHQAASPAQFAARISTMAMRRPLAPALTQSMPLQAALLRQNRLYAIDVEAEKRYAQEKLKPSPETVSTMSSVQGAFANTGSPGKEQDMLAGVKGDLNTVKETFEMKDVPKEAYYIGLAGVLPYLATSISTVSCAFELNHATAGYGYVLSTQTAEALLHILEPLQVGYGAVILSFLGAIHWGLEFAGYGGHHGYKRYAIGVVAPAVAWPTVMMPLEYALISQFCAFTFLYYADTRAALRGWTPSWYAIYRFTLTFIVGASIVLTLIGRSEVGDRVKHIGNPVETYTNVRETQEEAIEREEDEVIRAQQAAQESQSEDDPGKKSRE